MKLSNVAIKTDSKLLQEKPKESTYFNYAHESAVDIALTNCKYTFILPKASKIGFEFCGKT